MSTTAAGSSQNGRGTSSTQTNGGDQRKSPLKALPPVQDVQGYTELDQIQVHDWDEEAEEAEATTEEEELARVQQKIERLRQEQESIMRRQDITQLVKACIQHINRERARLAELQYTFDILRQQE
jgi:nucleosome binding factor SPN SPT16 subunit